MSREITCYVYDADDHRNVAEYLVTIGTKSGYTKPTVGYMNEFEAKLEGKLHKTEASLKRLANSSTFDLLVDVDERGSTRREEMPAALQEQADQYDADSVRHLRS